MKKIATRGLSPAKGSVGSGHGSHKGLMPAQLQAVAQLFDVLSEESRLAILQQLKAGPAGVGELVDALGMKQANVSKQLGLLMAGGVVSRRQEGNRAIYSIKLPLVFDLCELVCRGVAEQAAMRAAMLRTDAGNAAK